MNIPEPIQFPEIVQVYHPILPQSRDLIERPDEAAVLRVRLSHYWHAAAAAAAAHTCQHVGQRQCNGAAPHVPAGHPDNEHARSAQILQRLQLSQGQLLQLKEAGLNSQPPLVVLIKALILKLRG